MLTRYYSDNSYNSFDPFYFLTELGWPRASQTKKMINYNVTTTEKEELLITVDLPGVKKENLTIESLNQTITINAKRDDKDFTTSYKISKDYDACEPDASLEDGVLSLTFKKLKDTNKKTIKIR